jgi:hypothetical protein
MALIIAGPVVEAAGVVDSHPNPRVSLAHRLLGSPWSLRLSLFSLTSLSPST